MSDTVDDRWLCTLGQPLLLYVPPGETVTMPCPIHKDGHKINGGPTYL